jgi:hypothetical protein
MARIEQQDGKQFVLEVAQFNGKEFPDGSRGVHGRSATNPVRHRAPCGRNDLAGRRSSQFVVIAANQQAFRRRRVCGQMVERGEGLAFPSFCQRQR